jgi:hypothetical protein
MYGEWTRHSQQNNSGNVIVTSAGWHWILSWRVAFSVCKPVDFLQMPVIGIPMLNIQLKTSCIEPTNY